MQDLDPQIIRQLREMALEHRSISDMVRKILTMRDFSISGPIEVLRHFREAFGLSLPQGKPIADWLAYGGGESAEADLQTLVWPQIESHRCSWESEGHKDFRNFW